MSSVAFISMIATPSPISTVSKPSHVHSLDTVFTSLTTLPLGDRQAGRRRARHEPALLVQHVGLAEHQGLLHLDDPADRPNAPRDHRPDEVDLELDGRVPDAVLLKGRQRHPHRRVRDLRDDPALHDPAAVAVLRARLELDHDPPGLRLADPRT